MKCPLPIADARIEAVMAAPIQAIDLGGSASFFSRKAKSRNDTAEAMVPTAITMVLIDSKAMLWLGQNANGARTIVARRM